MINKEGFERDLALLKEWQYDLTSEEYQERLNKLYEDYELDEDCPTDLGVACPKLYAGF